MTTTAIIALAIYLIGCAAAYTWSSKNTDNTVFGNICISATSWLLVLLYAIHWLHNRQ